MGLSKRYKMLINIKMDRKYLVFLLAVLINSITLFSCKAQLLKTVGQTSFEYEKGINISAWLSQTSVGAGPERVNYFNYEDFLQLKDLGFDHIRLPVAEDILYQEDGKKNKETFQLIHNVIEWCEKNNMRIILDLHDLNVSRQLKSKPGQISLWESKDAQDHFINLWEQLSIEFKKYPNELLAYELLNEPVAPDPEIWNKLSEKTIHALRKLEPNRVIFLGSNKFNSVTTFLQLKVPEGDPNIILSFHYYHPGLLTHYNVNSYENTEGVSGLKLNYPGALVLQNQINALDEKSRIKLKQMNGFYDRQKLEDKLKDVFQKAKETGLRIHCGEFGSNFKYSDLSLQRRWIQDMVSIFKKHDIPYTVWGYRRNFGVFDDDRNIKDQAYLEAIVN